MDIFDNEVNIISHFQFVNTTEVLLLPESESVEHIFQSVHLDSEWDKWINSSGTNAPPPDFFCTSERLMMDVMRVDDHERISSKGQVVNPTRVDETLMMRELKERGILEQFPEAQPLVIGRTDLPTDQDHNYEFYRDSFNRTVRKHIKKIGNYKRNHPDYKVIFFVFDESSMYFEAEHKPLELKEGDITKGRQHYWFFDANFVEAFIGTEIDYLIWYTPYKHCQMLDDEGESAPPMPIVTVIDVKNYNYKKVNYAIPQMVSTEV